MYGLPDDQKPEALIIGSDGTQYALVGVASEALKRAGLHDEAEEMATKVLFCGSYDKALAIIQHYIKPVQKGTENGICCEMLIVESDLDCKNSEGLRDTIDCTTYFDYELKGNRLQVIPACTYITFDKEWWFADVMARVGVEGYVIIIKSDTLEITRYDLTEEGEVMPTPCKIVMAE